MKISFLIIILSLTISFYAKGNQDCNWTSSKAGVTIKYLAPCDFKNKSTLDSILNKVTSLINRLDTSFKIWVLLNQGQLSFPDSDFSNFFSIGYDTLREIDYDFLFNYYQNQTILSQEANNGVNKFESRFVPIDVNSTIRKAKSNVGIKIIYDRDYRIGKPDWTDIIKAIVYASKNVELIKSSQKRDTVRYNTNGWYVSLLTLDTFDINKIIGRQNESKQKEIVEVKPINIYLLLGLLGLIVFGVVVYKSRQHSRQH